MAKSYYCPCCGYLTLEEEPPGTYQICPVCFWEDAKTLTEWGINSCNLIDAQLNYCKYGACEKQWKDSVRLPLEDEPRLANWKTLADNYSCYKEKVVESIYKAFDDVKLEDGITVAETEFSDDRMFSVSNKKEDINERIQQQREHNLSYFNYFRSDDLNELDLEKTLKNWQEIDYKTIKNFYYFPFFDEKGFRFYLPAYMIWTIYDYENHIGNIFAEFIFFALENNNKYYLSHFEYLTKEQSEAVSQFLCFVAIYFYDNDAVEALEKYWYQFSQALGNEIIYRLGPY